VIILLAAVGPLLTLLVVRYGLGNVSEHYVGVIPMLLGLLVLAWATMASVEPRGSGASVLVPGIVAAVGLGWWGYRGRRRRFRDPSAELFLAMQAAPAPSARTIRTEEVLGAWRFYVDAAASTVTINLQSDGRYTQRIAGNGGDEIQCPGGAWTLDGPYLQLASYQSALRKSTADVRWSFGEREKGLVLFAKDDSQGETTLLGLRAAAGAIA
jgi:hypothetical protein